ncbi:Uncharacterised protein [Shigella sonnei]|nr:Uncharacterised protein [Shigella sonnei]CSF32679.1 Uncharacterised protein [Shigella sonnei]CSF49598.1 Uncharacterised protein [Shigella sonnei]CSP63633.1 Uncharacterised protein [Shigella sonnei]CSR86845.1 Uncharacterised protein [Shigella sonnei]
MLPDFAAGGGIRLAVLCIPGKARCHHLKLNAMWLQQIAFAIRPGAFNKLHDAHFFSVTNCACCRTKCRGGFAFSIAGKDDDNTAFILGLGHTSIYFFFHSLLTLLVAFITHWEIPGLRPGWASKVMPVLRRLSSPISQR